ncbi:hypothetical protein B566_EDAN000675 [Ephemera danica]|nr:hypothetical protein B566_EDAN000675 [Ephemera danica]
MMARKVVLLLFPFLSVVFASLDLQGAVDGLVTQLKSQSNATEQGGVVMVPTVSVDLWTLLRLAAQNELKLPWVEALTFCRIYGMDLASIETREEDQLISDHLNALGLGGTTDKIVHLSGNKIGRSTFIWLNGESLIYENWAPDEPNNIAIHHCICHHKTQWYDYPCGNENHFICEEP